jgi:hypothetical protein
VIADDFKIGDNIRRGVIRGRVVRLGALHFSARSCATRSARRSKSRKLPVPRQRALELVAADEAAGPVDSDVGDFLVVRGGEHDPLDQWRTSWT